jgi:hypothetical protein
VYLLPATCHKQLGETTIRKQKYRSEAHTSTMAGQQNWMYEEPPLTGCLPAASSALHSPLLPRKRAVESARRIDTIL